MKYVIDNEFFNYKIFLKPQEHDFLVLRSKEERAVYAAECALRWAKANDVEFPPILLVKAGKLKLYEVNSVPILIDIGEYATAKNVDKYMRQGIKKNWIIQELTDS